MFAEACRNAGRIDEGLGALTEALATTNQNAIRFYEPEMHRLKGELLLMEDSSNSGEAQRCFQSALELHGVKVPNAAELRAATSLARLLDKQGRRDEACAMLADIYNWFTEGFDTADLKEAKGLLEQLSAG